MKTSLNVLLIFFGLTLSFCSGDYPSLTDEEKKATILEEVIPQKLNISESLISKNPEFSGLTWFGDYLLLVPQFPNRVSHQANGAIPYLHRDSVIAAINDNNKILEPEYFKLIATGLENFFGPGSGLEAATVSGNNIYLTIESVKGINTSGFVVMGEINEAEKTIILAEESLSEIKQVVEIFNFSDETIISDNDHIYTLYEANGKNVNPYPVSHIFSKTLDPLGAVPSPSLEFRITDATSVDVNRRFWVINYYYPGEFDKIHPAVDSIVVTKGTGESHLKSEITERLVEFEIFWDKIVLTSSDPIMLKLDEENKAKNWEGIARLDNYGFLLTTDTYPETALYFIKTQN